MDALPKDAGCGRRWTAALALVLSLCGCTGPLEYVRNGFKVGPNYRLPAADTAADWIDAADPRVRAEPADFANWWSVFQDPVLDDLIQTAYRQNLDVRTAATRILEALAQRNVQAANLLPQSQTALGAYVHGQISQNFGLPFPSTFNLWATGFNASWELDFWGRLRRSIESAKANLDGAVEDYNNALVILLAEAATSYVQLRTFQQRIAFANKNIEIQKGALEIAEARFGKGVATQLDVQQARANLAQTEALVPPLQIGLRQANNDLCLLLGLTPHDLLPRLAPEPIPLTPEAVSVGIPRELLRRRPDVRRAERNVAAQSAQIGIAQADFYPRFVLFGFIGYTADNFARLFDASSYTGFIAPIFQWNILNYGRLLNNVRFQGARWHENVLTYQQTVLRAQREAENALIAFLKAQEQTRSLADSVSAYERSVDLVLDQYRNGTADFNRVFTTQAALVSAQDQWIAARGSIALNLIALYRALGGGWEIRFRKDIAPPDCSPASLPMSKEAALPEPSQQIPAPRRLSPKEDTAAAPEASNRPSSAPVLPIP
ncbi:MAG TPA: TolC family protein [Gemmataceae bacterium]|nr:TolC family protein [Gemmataceae bacterium]